MFIDVSNNTFHGGIPEAMWELVLLHGLNLSHNFLTGTIPSHVGHLDQLEALDMSSNELSGVLPQEITSYIGLLDNVEPIIQQVGWENTRITSFLDVFQ